ncbi:MAG: PAS domain S-box protein, partial [Ignavibacteria bacterium]
KWQKVLAEKSVFEHEYQIITKSGEIRWVWERGRGIYDENGEVVALEGFITDVTERVNFRQQLIESNEKLKLLVEGTPYFFFYTHDIEGRITYISPSVEKITGYKVEEWIGTNHWFLTDNPINEKARINTRKMLMGEPGNFPVYIEIYHKNGTEITLEIFEVPNYKEGKIIGLHGIARDVTIEKRFQDKLIKSEERFRKLFVEHSAVKLLIDPDNGQIYDANKSAEHFYGYSIEELKSMRINFIQISSVKEPSVREIKNDLYVKNFYEAKHKLKNGTIKDVAVFVSKIEIEGKEYFHIIVHDITEAKRFERELLFEKTKFQQLFDNSPIAIAIVDRHKKIQIDNEQFRKFFNLKNNEEIGQSFLDICCPGEMETLHRNFFLKIFEGEKLIQETYLTKKDGSLAYVQIMGVPIFLDTEIIGVFVLIVDITKIKEAEESMKAAKEMAEMASKMKDTFIANISHEIRTPLNAILGYTELVREAAEQLLEAEEKNYFNIIRSAGNRLMRTIEMIMNYSRITVGDFPIKKQKIN